MDTSLRADVAGSVSGALGRRRPSAALSWSQLVPASSEAEINSGGKTLPKWRSKSEDHTVLLHKHI